MEDDPVVRFTMAGQRFELRKSEVSKKMEGAAPEPLRSHAVQIEGTWYPVKQAMERATGLDRSDFISTAARTQFKKLGFDLRHD